MLVDRDGALVIVGILLAAGRGSRFGGGKLMALLGDGTPVGVRAARTLAGAVDRALAVVRPGESELARLLAAEGLDVREFPGADEGMGASLAFGVAAAPEADGWLVALADMPWVRLETARAVAGLLGGGALVAAPSRGGRRGHPVGFGRSLISELLGLRGDRGAREILSRQADRVTLLDVDDDGILLDVDELQDLARRDSEIEKKLSI
jgi:molybdenum cofactor cytidylyltransferase